MDLLYVSLGLSRFLAPHEVNSVRRNSFRSCVSPKFRSLRVTVASPSVLSFRAPWRYSYDLTTLHMLVNRELSEISRLGNNGTLTA